MREKTTLPGEGNQARIDLPNEERIQYWAKKLSCNRSDLLNAVINVGNSYNSVEAFLCMNHRQDIVPVKESSK